ncbi:inositol-tetrakisphosphate 1-kinase isoform X2 [Cephus cinctus]|uniref:Inositol-tetrakisphosphate 1-kinase n=1 Tax=Cephus cinctus TaxID=211228 RepID=A0AAJ7FDZ8_CEPCN|nr:inositol-tetrakisphosphate 1-kinase isoform X2 [Cephus cinctus]
MDNNQRVIGYWISEKKKQKFNWEDFQNVCAKNGFELKMINVNANLESQGPFHVFLHKLTDTLALAESGDQNARAIITRIQGYIRKHPELIVIDPLENVRNLRNRHKSYEIIHNGIQLKDVFTPNFVELKSKYVSENLTLLITNNVKFPFLCKRLVAHGCSDAHKMMVIFNEKGLKDCQLPCVAQNFVNHNAILYKVFIVGEKFHVVERPSLKNFYQKDCESLNTIFFNSQDISKSGSNSKWSVISDEEAALRVKPNFKTFEKIVKRITKIFGLVLVGVDVVIENHTERYAIIDINAFPGYDGYPHFFDHLVNTIEKLMADQKSSKQNSRSAGIKKWPSDDLDSGFESDEKKKQSMT